MAVQELLPEAEALYWRPRVDAARLRQRGRLWTLSVAFHVVTFVTAAVLLMWVQPLALPVAIVCLAHAWVIPELYAQRGANVLRPRRRGAEVPEQRSVGLLGDRIAHLLLALRADEQGFATVANLSFAGARWRLRRRMPASTRSALDFAAL